jgi:hypothetical protein
MSCKPLKDDKIYLTKDWLSKEDDNVVLNNQGNGFMIIDGGYFIYHYNKSSKEITIICRVFGKESIFIRNAIVDMECDVHENILKKPVLMNS